MFGGKGTGIKEYNIGNMRGIGTARGLIEMSQLKPLSGKCKVIILNECHKATNEFWNAMLEILEEPPKNTYFILCTTEPQKVLTTVKSRCTKYDMKPLTSRDMTRYLRSICKKERIDIEIPVLKKIWKAVDGTPREALVLLDQIISLGDDEGGIENAIETFVNSETQLMDLINALVGNAKWKTISPIVKNLNEDPESIRYAIMAVLANMMLRNPTDTLSEIGTLFEETFIHSGKFGLVNACYLATKVRN